MERQEFYQRFEPYAMQVYTATGIQKSVVLAVWSWESNFCKSNLSMTGLNLAGIKQNSDTIKSYGRDSRGFCNYKTYGDFTSDFIHFMQRPAYRNVLTVAKQGDAQKTALEFAKSPYNASHYNEYNGSVGSSLINRMNEDNLINSYDKKPHVSGIKPLTSSTTLEPYEKIKGAWSKLTVPVIILIVLLVVGGKIE